MKAQISRDSFDEKKQYSAVYQQQGRMITDADWNEMVRILKQRMDHTVGAAIESGSPREGGILSKDVIEWNWSSPKELFKGAIKLKCGRIYVDGMYGEIRSSKPEATSEQSVKNFIKDQKDFPGNPADHLEQGSYYIAYIDLWERLVVALEEKHLRDAALHGADTCVRTQTMSQLKLAKLKAKKHDDAVTEVIEKWEHILADPEVPDHEKPIIPHGNATLVNPDSGSPAPAASAAHKNALFRLEVHESSSENSQHTVVLKWSDENGAEQHDNEITSDFPNIPNFWEEKYIYECYSDETEKHMGQHKLEGDNGWNSKKAKLYTYDVYKTERSVAGSPAKQMPYVRRWDGYVTLKRMKAEKKWEVVESESSFGPHVKVDWKDNPSGNICQSLVLKNTEFRYKLELSTVKRYKLELSAVKKRGREDVVPDIFEDVPDIFMVGDYWLVLLRDKGATLSAEVLSEEPVGIYHHYLVLGVYIGTYHPMRPTYILLTPKQWRRLSFPSLTNLTLDRVLVKVKDKNGKEISVEDKFVDVEGDTMTGTLNVKASVHVKGSDSNDAKLYIEGEADNDETINFRHNAELKAVLGWDAGDGVLKLKANDTMAGSEGINIQPDGRVGIGIDTPDPSAKLEVRGGLRAGSLELVPPQFPRIMQVLVGSSELSNGSTVTLGALQSGIKILFDGEPPLYPSSAMCEVAIEIPAIGTTKQRQLLYENEYYEHVTLSGQLSRIKVSELEWSVSLSVREWLEEVLGAMHHLQFDDWVSMTGDCSNARLVQDLLPSKSKINVDFTPPASLSWWQSWAFRLLFYLGYGSNPVVASAELLIPRSNSESTLSLYCENGGDNFGIKDPESGDLLSVKRSTVGTKIGDGSTTMQVTINQDSTKWLVEVDLAGTRIFSEEFSLPKDKARVGIMGNVPMELEKITVADQGQSPPMSFKII